MICNDRRWPETYRVMGLQGVELILCGYNTPIHYAPDPSQDVLQGFHNALVMQSGRLPERHVGGRAWPRAGWRRGWTPWPSPPSSPPSGQIVAQALTTGDELIVARCDLDWCRRYTGTLFDFDRYRMPELYGRITAQRGGAPPPIDELRRSATHDECGIAAARRDDGSGRRTVDFTLNGTAVTVRADHPHLLAALREELDVTSPKDGCSPSGQCGCCTVLVDGKAVVSCNLALAKVAGQDGHHPGGLRRRTRWPRYADTFAACGGLQCGFCIPGIVVRAKALVDKKGASLTRGRWPATWAPTCAGAPAT